jgi:hypothetical protein
VSERIAYHLDEHVPKAVARGLRKFGIDVTTPSDANLLEATDSTHLEYARRNGRVMITYDADYIRLHRNSVEHAEIIYVVPRSRTIGRIIEFLHLYYETSSPDQMKNRLEYL